MKKNNSYKKQVWTTRILLFLIFLTIFLAIKNEWQTHDEHWYAVNLDQGVSIFHGYQVLRNASAYLVWWIVTLIGFEISAFRALQITTSIFSAMGAVALVDLAIFWGLSLFNALLVSLPTILCNGFVHYGTSAYPHLAAVGMGLVATNLLIRVVDRQITAQDRTQDNKRYFRSFYLIGGVLGLALLIHLVSLIAIFGLFFGILFVMSKKKSLVNILKPFLAYFLGFCTVVGMGYAILFIVLAIKPDLVICLLWDRPGTISRLLVCKLPSWLPRFNDLVTNTKTFLAVYVPGIHVSNHLLNILANIPRIILPFIFSWILYRAWIRRRENIRVSSWIIPLTISIATSFFILLFTDSTYCRQYAAFALLAFGPLFIAINISAFEEKTSFSNRFPAMIVLFAFLLYTIFGIQGLTQMFNSNFGKNVRAAYSKCDIHRPKPVQFPWNVDKRSLDPNCPQDKRGCHSLSEFYRYIVGGGL